MYYFVEKPWRLNYSKSKKYLSIVALISVLGFCYLIIIQNGYVNRLNENEKNYLINSKPHYKMNIALLKSIFKNVVEKICIKGDEANADIILLGDSNARMWFKPFSNFSEEKNYSLINYSRICNNFPHPQISMFLIKDFILKILRKCSK